MMGLRSKTRHGKTRQHVYRKTAKVNAKATGVRHTLGLGAKSGRRAAADPLGVFALNTVNKAGRRRRNGGFFRGIGR